MAESRQRRKAKPKQPRLIRAGDRTMTFVVTPEQEEDDGLEVPSQDDIEAALSGIPDDLNWEWASRRLIPIFERGYGEGVTGDPMVNTVTSLGVGIGFGIDFGPVFGRVTRSMAQRWEASVEQIEHLAFAHLADVAAGVSQRDLQSVVHHGHLFRALGEPGGWASSIVLAGEDELTRIFGVRDATFVAPARNSLLAFGPGTPGRAIDEITFMLESADPNPLRMEPFVMEAGVLRWEGAALDALDLDDVI
jgi:hypothetical protein